MNKLGIPVSIGDSNVRFKSASSYDTGQMKTLLVEYNITHVVLSATYTPGNILDWITTKSTNSLIHPVLVLVLDATVSDHHLIEAYVSRPKPKPRINLFYLENKISMFLNSKTILRNNFGPDVLT